MGPGPNQRVHQGAVAERNLSWSRGVIDWSDRHDRSLGSCGESAAAVSASPWGPSRACTPCLSQPRSCPRPAAQCCGKGQGRPDGSTAQACRRRGPEGPAAVPLPLRRWLAAAQARTRPLIARVRAPPTSGTRPVCTLPSGNHTRQRCRGEGRSFRLWQQPCSQRHSGRIMGFAVTVSTFPGGNCILTTPTDSTLQLRSPHQSLRAVPMRKQPPRNDPQQQTTADQSMASSVLTLQSATPAGQCRRR